MTEGRRQKADDGRQRTDDRSQRTDGKRRITSFGPAAGLKSNQFDRKLKLQGNLNNLILVI
jgi:hypothetical protein